MEVNAPTPSPQIERSILNSLFLKKMFTYFSLFVYKIAIIQYRAEYLPRFQRIIIVLGTSEQIYIARVSRVLDPSAIRSVFFRVMFYSRIITNTVTECS